MNSDHRPQNPLLLCSRNNDAVLALQSAVFRKAGYQVTPAASLEAILEHIENTDFGVMVLNHTISFADRKKLAKKTKPQRAVLPWQ